MILKVCLIIFSSFRVISLHGFDVLRIKFRSGWLTFSARVSSLVFIRQPSHSPRCSYLISRLDFPSDPIATLVGVSQKTVTKFSLNLSKQLCNIAPKFSMKGSMQELTHAAEIHHNFPLRISSSLFKVAEKYGNNNTGNQHDIAVINTNPTPLLVLSACGWRRFGAPDME